MEAFGVVYLLIDGTNDKEYVGQTTKTAEERFKYHKSCNKSYIGNAIRAHGAENFVIAILKVCKSKEELDYWEKYFIKARNTKYPHGYNFTDGGEGTLGHKHTPETIALMKKKHKGRKLTPEQCANIKASKMGEKNPFFGKKHTPESIAKMKKTRTGRRYTPEHCANIAAGLKGRKFTPEHCKNISESKKGEKHPFYGKHHTPEHCANIAAGLKGRKLTPEHCAHISESKMGTHVEDEARDKMAESRSGERNPNFGKPRPPEVAFQISTKNRSESPYKNLVAEMDAMQMSVAALARFLGIRSSTLSAKIRGKRNFTSEQIAKIEELLQKPAPYLFERDENFCLEPVTDRRKSPYKNLIAELDARGFSFPKVAELIGSSKSSIAKKMRGERNFKDSEKKRLAEILGKPIEFLLQRE